MEDPRIAKLAALITQMRKMEQEPNFVPTDKQIAEKAVEAFDILMDRPAPKTEGA